jgi:hypothetical protein
VFLRNVWYIKGEGKNDMEYIKNSKPITVVLIFDYKDDLWKIYKYNWLSRVFGVTHWSNYVDCSCISVDQVIENAKKILFGDIEVLKVFEIAP